MKTDVVKKKANVPDFSSTDKVKWGEGAKIKNEFKFDTSVGIELYLPYHTGNILVEDRTTFSEKLITSDLP